MGFLCLVGEYLQAITCLTTFPTIQVPSVLSTTSIAQACRLTRTTVEGKDLIGCDGSSNTILSTFSTLLMAMEMDA